jgi:MOSC domain-containing protein YiiM
MRIHTLSIGTPETRVDQRGEWVSAIHRKPVDGRVYLSERGLAGDEVADHRHHGSPNQAVCVHPLEHYEYWNSVYPGAIFGPATLGENWTVTGMNEQTVCIGDAYRAGSAVVQVSAPRIPCSTQERKVGLPGFLARVVESRRTGWYLRVLTPGEVGAGDELALVSRPARPYTVAQVNENFHGEFDPVFTEELIASPDLEEEWKDILRKRLERHTSAQ